MKKALKKTVATIEALAEEIEALNLNDHAAWRTVQEKLAGLRDALETTDGPAATLIDRCGRGATAVAAKTAPSLFQMADAVAGGLYAAAGTLAGSDGADPQGALVILDTALADVAEDADNAAGGGKPAVAAVSPPTLDDLAARLVQIEPDDAEETAALLDMAGALLAAADPGAPWCEPVARARDLVAKAARDVDPESLFTEVGRLIETALERRDEPEGRTAPEGETDGGAAAGDDPDDYMPAEADNELLGEFINEGLDLVAKAEDALLSLENDPEDMEAVGMIFRAFHTVKGTAAFMDLSLIAEMGHHAESLLSRVRDREIRYAGGYADLCLRALDMIKELIQAVQGALGGEPLCKPEAYDELMTVLSDPEAHGICDDEEAPEAPRLGDLLVAQGKVSREAVEATVQDGDPGPIGSRLVKAKAATLCDVSQALRAQRSIKTRTAATLESSIRVGTARLDRLIDAVGELVIAHSMVAQDDIVNTGNHHDLQKKIAHTSKIVRELQDMSMSLRMVPLKGTFSKMARLVRDLSKKIGKSVNFVTEGEDTEIDRNLVDVISDPLVHMVRNAVDHGIELPAAREAAGKPTVGQVKLAAYHSAGSVVVEISDDGKGLDRDKVLAKARERGLLAEGANPSEREVFNLVFEPGFSTAEQVTDVSGRGVGMDVVKRNIESLRGQVEIESEQGRGSVFKMSLPLTLAIIDGMVVRVGSERYIIPTVSIIRSVKPDVADLSTVLRHGEMLTLKDALIPLYRIGRLFKLDGAQREVMENAIVVVVEDKSSQAGLIIDELIGRQQVVIKSLGDSMRDIPGISGGAIMPNGRVGLILDVPSLVKFANTHAAADPGDGAGTQAPMAVNG